MNEDLSSACIYTIRHSHELGKTYDNGGRGEFVENSRWTTGSRIFEQARQNNQRVALLFAAAEADIIGGVIYWGLIDEVTLAEETTTVRYSALKPILPKLPLTSLIKLSTDEPLSENYIRPYVPCRTPAEILSPIRMLVLSERFEKALNYATVIHAGQFRKATGIPYIGHLLGVASIALEYGADEDTAIAALLHDAGEDAGGLGRIEDIRTRFGHSVATIVEGCTDAVTVPKPPWRERKERYIAHLASADEATILVSASDKLHNARAILRDFRVQGDRVFDRFSGKKEGTLWYYRSLVTAFREHGQSELVEELDCVVVEIETLAGT
jgi:hypothetical protein